MVTNLLSQAMILIKKICNNMCIADLIIVRCDSLTCLSAQSENAEV